ncbi:ricin-type beta-trefoil lectin domain protein [Micromonospora sp. NPDC049274]|uniref:ricin-type beta-trefoil lectin domain protein n=1 Tax=Micromonospora sp. NPDC049274 TaxID=3154829 RepID=UPI00341BC1B3
MSLKAGSSPARRPRDGATRASHRAEKQAPARAPGRLWGAPARRVVIAGAALTATALLGVAAFAGFGAATAEDSTLPGRPVPGEYEPLIAAASLSCPALTPARLSGQLMAESHFDPSARTSSGGSGLGGLSDDLWQKWKPSPQAQRLDPAANILALAHRMCDLVGQVRSAGGHGNLWQLALGAHHSSATSAAALARAVPDNARGYVDRVSRYVAWYDKRAQGGGTPAPGATTPVAGGEPRPVPAVYLASVQAAGRICPEVTPPRVAAQLMASSAFNPNLLGADGAQGIAQFRPQLWSRFGPNVGAASVWDPSIAIPALGQAMCGLTKEMGKLSKEPYQAALAAFRWGADPVQQAGGAPQAPALRSFVDAVTAYTAFYAQEPVFGGKPGATASPGAPASPGRPGPSATGSPGSNTEPDVSVPGGPTRGADPSTSAPTSAPAPPPPPPAGVSGPVVRIRGHESDRCIDVTDGSYNSNPVLQIWTCNTGSNQRWTLGSDGTVRAFGKCMTVAGGSTTSGADIVLSTCNGSASQRFDLNGSHDLVNPRADKCVEARGSGSGSKLRLAWCAGSDDQKWSRS